MRSVCLTCLVLFVVQGLAQAAEVQVNVRTSGAQANAAVAAGAGGSVIVWSCYFSSSGRSNDIFARRLDAQGRFLGDEFQVNQATTGNQTEPAVAMDGQGRFAIAWHGPGPDQEDIFLRLFDPSGNATADELLVNLAVAGRQRYPSVAFGGAGTLVVAWESLEATPAGSRTVIRVQLFDPNGFGLGGEVLVDTDLDNCRSPQVAMDGAGRFAVTWQRDRTGRPTLVRLFDSYGVPITAPLQVSTAVISSLTEPAIAMNARGHFVVAWDGHPSRASDDDVYARLYDPNGVPRGEPFVVNTVLAGAQQLPQVALNDANEFVIVWEHDTGDPSATWEVTARYFDASGLPVGNSFQLNMHTSDQQRAPDVALAADGSFLTAWQSRGQDGSDWGIFATRWPSPQPSGPNKESTP